MVTFLQDIDKIVGLVAAIRTILVVIIIFIIFHIMLAAVKKSLLQKAKTKRQISNIKIFSRILNYFVLLIIIIAAMFSYQGSWSGLGITVGLLSAALGWALQKPITGMAAWIMIVLRRPFDIGDRIIIGSVKGDVVDITLTHVYIQEIGGIVEGEESSGRIIMVPNSVLFEQNIINYTFQNEYVLDQVSFTITHQSNLNRAIEIGLESAKSCTEEFIKITKQEPYVRTFFNPSGINVHVRYLSPAQRLQEFSSKITKEVLNKVMKSKDVEIAYPHTKIILTNGKKK